MIIDEFLLGTSILVAPVLEKGARQRSVQFPPGYMEGRRWYLGAWPVCDGRESAAEPNPLVSQNQPCG